MIGEAELPPKRSHGNPMIQELPLFLVLAALDRDDILLSSNGDVARREASQCQRNLVLVVAYALDVIRGLAFLAVALRRINEIDQPVEADRRTPQRRKIKSPHSQILHRANWIRADTGHRQRPPRGALQALRTTHRGDKKIRKEPAGVKGVSKIFWSDDLSCRIRKSTVDRLCLGSIDFGQ